MPKISIITPAYKAEPFIARAVKGILAQTVSDWEMIIVADDMQDYQSFLKAQNIADERLRFASTGRTKAGPSVGRNIGLDMATSQIIAHLDADDAYAANYLEVIIPKVQRYGACTAKMRLLDEATGVENNKLLVLTEDKALRVRDMLEYNFAYVNIVFDRERCNVRWPEALQYGEDIMLWAMLLDHIPSIYFSTQTHYAYYKRTGSLSHLTDSADDTKLIYDRLRLVQNFLDNKSSLKNQENLLFLKAWFTVRADLEQFFNFRIADAGVYQAELTRRFKEFLEDKR